MIKSPDKEHVAFKLPSAVAATPSECTHLLLLRDCSTKHPASHGWEYLASRRCGGLVARGLYLRRRTRHSSRHDRSTRGIRTLPTLLKPLKKIRILKC